VFPLVLRTGGFYFNPLGTTREVTVPQEDIVWQRNTSQNETYRSNTSHLLIILTPI
jgi:hypothetical protein